MKGTSAWWRTKAGEVRDALGKRNDSQQEGLRVAVENVVIIGDLNETDPDARGRQRQFAQFALDEINRIISEFGKPM
ncbi:hypothetical protein IIA16_06455 [bacterium]|nr:hypothetical protein [bacterium]